MSNSNLQMRDFNFFSGAIGIKNSQRKKAVVYLLFLALYLIIAAGIYFLLQMGINSGTSKLQQYDAYLQSDETALKRQQVQDKKQEHEKLAQYNEYLEALNRDLKGDAVIGSEFIGQIVSTIPKDLYFESISMSYNQLQIQGNASSRIKIAEFQSNMQELGLFEDVYISSINTVPEGEDLFTFTMACQLKEVIEE